jgi:hypothetical protein
MINYQFTMNEAMFQFFKRIINSLIHWEIENSMKIGKLKIVNFVCYFLCDKWHDRMKQI